MPLLFSLGQHSALEAVSNRLQADDKLMAFLDDVYVVNARPDNVLHSYRVLVEEFWTDACIRINGGKTQVWNQSGDLTGVTSCKELQSCQIQMLSCGEVPMFRPCTKASKFWGRLLGTMISCRTSWNELPTNINNSWICCLLCRTCSQVGCFWCIVHRPGQIICCALYALTVSRGLLKHTTEGCGSVCARC